MNEILPSIKFVPLLSSAAAIKVISSTGTSAYEREVNRSTSVMITAAIQRMMFISPFKESVEESPTSLETYVS